MKAPAVFFDRDGTIIRQVACLADPAQALLLPGAGENIRLLRKAGFRVILVTNQAAVARGIVSEAQVAEIHHHLGYLLSKHGALLDGIYFCPHHPLEGRPPYRRRCQCRKPAPGMLMQAAREKGLDLTSSYMVGDQGTDIEAGWRAGCRSILVLTGHGREEATREKNWLVQPDLIAKNLSEATRWILGGPK